MSDPRDKEPDLGRVEDVDDSTHNVAPLRTEGSDPDPEPSFSAANGLTTRDQPGAAGPDAPEGDDEPGASLRRAREAEGVDTATLASRIHLGRGTLEDLEANRFHHMPPAYVRGYLRSCARELGVDATPWLQAFERHGLVDPELQAVATPSARARRRRRGRGVYWLALLLVAGLLALGVYAWSERTDTPVLPSLGLTDARDALPGLPGTAQSPEAETPGVANDAVAEAETPEAAAPVEDAAVDAPATTGVDEPAAEADAAASPGVAPETLVETVAEPVESEPSEPAAAGGSEDAPDAARVAETDAVAPAAPEAGVRLELEFAETSWVEIRDAADEVVLTGVLSSGDRETLRLELPARVILGNAAGVSLILEGEPVDLEPHIRSDRTARFDLEG